MTPDIRPEKASIETTVACNHTCSYCPASKFPQKQRVMPLDFFDYAMKELKSLDRHLRRISFTHYNEPLLDPFLVERVRIATNYSFYNVIVLFSNLSIMEESLPKNLQFARERLVFSVNLPTTNRERYKKIHGRDHYARVEANIGKLVDRDFEVKINLQSSTLTSPEDREGVMRKFGNLIPVDIIASDSRAGLVTKLAFPKKEGILAGCSIKRPINHVHIGIKGEVFLCCQDFFKRYRFGSLKEKRLKDILTSKSARKYLEYIYGGKETPSNFICRACEFVIYKKQV